VATIQVYRPSTGFSAVGTAAQDFVWSKYVNLAGFRSGTRWHEAGEHPRRIIRTWIWTEIWTGAKNPGPTYEAIRRRNSCQRYEASKRPASGLVSRTGHSRIIMVASLMFYTVSATPTADFTVPRYSPSHLATCPSAVNLTPLFYPSSLLKHIINVHI
jgi:hypothetical protein